jgi:mono/diheme cytochrome c family protein
VTPEFVAAGKALFEINCALCHGQTSSRPGPVGSKLTPPPPTLGHDMVRGLPDTLLLTAITNGFGRMPPFRDKLTPRERQQLLHFLRTRT